MNHSKQLVMQALAAFVKQRPGLEYADYGNIAAYRGDARRITQALNDYRELERYVLIHNEITADVITKAAESAFSGRLEFNKNLLNCTPPVAEIRYTTGKYWPTEYRNAACAVLAVAIWAYARDNIKTPTLWRVVEWGLGWKSGQLQIHAAAQLLTEKGGDKFGYVDPLYDGLSAGDYLRNKMRALFGRGIQSRWFN